MNERTKQFRVGVVVFAMIITTSILILWNSDFSALPFRSKYQVKLLVDQAPGVAADTPVRRRGLPIGRVDSVEDTDDGALITLNIDADKQIKSNESGRIQSSLVGDAIIEFVPVRSAVGAQPVPPDATIRGIYAPNPMDLIATLQGDLRQTIISLGNAGEEVAELADRLNTVMGENDMERITRLVDTADSALREFGEVASNINDLIGDPQFRADMKEGLAKMPAVMTDAAAVLEKLETAVSSADENLKNLQGLTGPLGERGTVIVGNLERSVHNLEDLLQQLAVFTRSINESEGTLGLLIHERQTYDQLQVTLAQANAAICDIRKITDDPAFRARIRQILDNIAALTNKLARDPARLARGVINRETPIK